jgi:multiple antibiotic resistance protein
LEFISGDFIKVLTALVALANPIGLVPIFLAMTQGRWERERSAIARQTSFAIVIILAISTVAGDYLLEFFGISIHGFRVAGGILVMIMALSMMQAHTDDVRQTDEELSASQLRPAIAVVPLAMPITAGPGAISAMIVYSHTVGYLVSFAAIICLAVILYLFMRSASFIARALGTVGMNVVTRIMGLLLASMAVEFIASGVRGLLPGLV